MGIHNFTKIRYWLIFPIIVGFLAFPFNTKAAWTDVFGSIGYGGYSAGQFLGSGSSNNYNTDAIIGQHNGEIRLSKRVRRVNEDQNYHETRVIRSGTLVEVWIEVKNNSSQNASVTVTDELGGNVVYKKDSLRVNGQPSTPGLTSGGLSLNMPAKSVYIITYQMYVCGGSGYATRANAYAAGVGSATDAIIIQEEYSQYNNAYGSQYAACMNQVQGTGTVNAGTHTSNPFGDWYGVNNSSAVNSTVNNPFGDWRGVNNSSAINSTVQNPFGDWHGVNNASSISSTVQNPFGDWRGVNNANSTMTTVHNPFGDWRGVNNAGAIQSTVNNPFGDWYGVNNASSSNISSTSYSNSTNPFGDWYGVQNSGTVNNPFGDWYGVNNGSSVSYDSRGYTTTSTDTASSDSGRQVAYAPRTIAGSTATTTYPTTNYVAPRTGVNTTAPILFGLLATGAFFGYRHRRWLFN